MDATKSDEDEDSEVFGLQFPSQIWNFGPSSTSNTPTSGATTSVSTSYSDSRFSRLSSADFQDTGFADLNTPEYVVSSNQYNFTKPPDRVTTRLEDFEEENGFDSGFGSLQLTPSEIQSDGVCENNSPQSTSFLGRSTRSDDSKFSDDYSLTKEHEERESNLNNFEIHQMPHQTVGQKRNRMLFEYSNKSVQRCLNSFDSTNGIPPNSNNVRGLFILLFLFILCLTKFFPIKQLDFCS